MSSALSSSTKKSQNKAETWQQVFGVQANPFVNNNRVFYPGGQRQENLNALRHLVHYSNRILLVTGNKGSGKTFLLDKLCACEKEGLKLARIKPKLLQGSTSLLQNMAAVIDLSVNPKESNTELMDKIKVSCEKRFINGFKTLFIIDDAQDLSNDSLELLVSFFTPETQVVCGLLLLAQVQIIDQIRKICAGSNVQPFHQIQLKTFTRAETVAYVEHYLVSAGWGRQVPLSPKICIKLHALGQGLPGRINRIAPSVLLSESMPSRQTPHKHLLFFCGILTAALTLTFIVIVYQYRLDDGGSKAGKTGKQTVTLKINEAEDFKPTNKEMLPPKALATNKQLKEEKEKLTAEPGSQLTVKDERKDATADQPSGAQGQAGADLSGKTTVSQKTIGKVKSAEPAEESGTPAVKEAAVVSSGVIEQAASKKNQAVLADQRSTSDTPAKQELLTQSAYLRTQDWIDAQAEGSWTIQILGVRDEKLALSFLKESQFTGDYFYVKSSYRSKDWYVVLQGIYPTKETAKTGLNKLPAKLRSSGAWFRSIAGLKSR